MCSSCTQSQMCSPVNHEQLTWFPRIILSQLHSTVPCKPALLTVQLQKTVVVQCTLYCLLYSYTALYSILSNVQLHRIVQCTAHCTVTEHCTVYNVLPTVHCTAPQQSALCTVHCTAHSPLCSYRAVYTVQCTELKISRLIS